MKLLIVESPGKIKKLKSFLGEGWTVAASVGHITDLPRKELGVDKGNRYKLLFDILDDKKNVVASLKREVAKVGPENVYLGTDEDREGEAISFHLCQTLGLPFKTTKRVTFNEITEKAVKAAIGSPRTLNLHLVAAYQCRRGIDRLVGYEVSPVLWQFIRGHKGLSAGRVQSVAVRLVVEREREIAAFEGGSRFIVTGNFLTVHGETIRAKLAGVEIRDENLCSAYLYKCKGKTFSVAGVEKKEESKNPPSPFSTSTLQQEAYKKLKFGVKKTMQLAQRLYEGGLITYMRTDSVNLSDDALKDAESYILKTFGKDYHCRRVFKNKNETAQEAHEAIRATHFDTTAADIGEEENRLYQLIFNRALASQMAPAKFNKTTITIGNNLDRDLFVSNVSEILFEGYLRAYKEGEEEETTEDKAGEAEAEGSLLKYAVNKGDVLTYNTIKAAETYEEPPKRYNEASLVKELEKKGIGRPSTYASIIGTIQAREYIRTDTIKGEKRKVSVLELTEGQVTKTVGSQLVGAEKDKFVATEVGEVIIRFLEAHFAEIIAYDFTAGIEADFDKVIEQKETYFGVIGRFDAKLSTLIENTLKGGEAPQVISHSPGLKCPKCGKGELKRGDKNYYCSDYKNGCDFRLYYEVFGKKLTDGQVKELVENGRTRIIKGLVGKSEKPFDAALMLVDFKIKPEFV